jgi:Anti-sigma factor NepR
MDEAPAVSRKRRVRQLDLLGSALRAHFQTVVEEPLPTEFVKMIDELGEKMESQ